jgi:hypothetical protein
MMVAAERFNQVLFGWLEADLFHRYVVRIDSEAEVLARMPEAIRRRYRRQRRSCFAG